MYDALIATLQANNDLLEVRSSGVVWESLLSPYKTKIYNVETGEFGTYGRGSAGCAKSVILFGDMDRSKPAITFGSFCQTSYNCWIYTGGEHNNHLAINNSLSAFLDMHSRLAEQRPDFVHSRSRGPITIGNGVVISGSCTVLSGVVIGDGALIAAGAVVTEDVPPFAIVGGVPARLIRYRFEPEMIAMLQHLRWWDFRLDMLEKHFFDIQKLPDLTTLARLKALGEKRYAKPDNRYFVLSSSRGEGGVVSFSVAGVEIDGQFIPLEHAPLPIRFLVEQMMKPAGSQIYLVKHIFEYI